jgi:hypothetical protein
VGRRLIKVHTPKTVHEFPTGTRFSTEEDYNNLCIWDRTELLGVFADGMWVLVEFGDG